MVDSHAGCGACGAGGSGRRADGGCGGVSDADRGGRGSGDGAAVAVIVPGVGTTADNFDHGLGGVRRRSPAWQARQLYAAAGGARSRIAVVAWLGYQPPSGVGIAAARSERAIEGARALRRYLRGLPGKVVLIGHSYGSLVLAYAARRLPRNVTDLYRAGGEVAVVAVSRGDASSPRSSPGTP